MKKASSKFTQIPEHTFETADLIHYPKGIEATKLTCAAFQISDFITYGEYKVYLNEIKQDSSNAFYLKQLPDSTMCSPAVAEEYINSSKFDKKPVLGISWESASNYCNWLAIKHGSDSLGFTYRLPQCAEWLSALYFFAENKTKHDLNNYYSEWLVNSRPGVGFTSQKQPNNFYYSESYDHKQNDPPALKRKMVIGNSYLFQYDKALKYNLNYYADKGYKFVAFRIVKTNTE